MLTANLAREILSIRKEISTNNKLSKVLLGILDSANSDRNCLYVTFEGQEYKLVEPVCKKLIELGFNISIDEDCGEFADVVVRW